MICYALWKRCRSLLFSIYCLAVLLVPSHSNAQSFPPAWSTSATYAAGDIVQYGGNWYRAMTALAAGGPYPAAAYGKWELNYVRSNTTLTIGAKQSFANIVYAWQFARNARIADAAYLHLNIVTTYGTFNESFSAPFSLDHSSGALISLIGDTADAIVLTFPDINGFVVDSGHSFNAISNMILSGVAVNSATGGHGISATYGATIANVSDVHLENFGSGAYADQNGSIFLGNTVFVVQCYTAMTADHGGTITAAGVSFILDGSAGPALLANHNGTITDESAGIENSSTNGVGALAENGGVIDVNSSLINGWSKGCEALYGGRITASNASFASNTVDLVAQYSGTIYAVPTTLDDGSSTGTDDGSYIWT